MKCWAWEYFRTSVASRAIFFRRAPDLAGWRARRAGALVINAAPAVERPMAETNLRLVQFASSTDLFPVLMFGSIPWPAQSENGHAAGPRIATRPKMPPKAGNPRRQTQGQTSGSDQSGGQRGTGRATKKSTQPRW